MVVSALYSPFSSYPILTEKRKFGKLKLIAVVQKGGAGEGISICRGNKSNWLTIHGQAVSTERFLISVVSGFLSDIIYYCLIIVIL